MTIFAPSMVLFPTCGISQVALERHKRPAESRNSPGTDVTWGVPNLRATPGIDRKTGTEAAASKFAQGSTVGHRLFSDPGCQLSRTAPLEAEAQNVTSV